LRLHLRVQWGTGGKSAEMTSDASNQTNLDTSPQRMADDYETRLFFAQKGRVLRGAMKAHGIRVVDVADEIAVSQGHLSRILETYCDLDIATCKSYLDQVEGVLKRYGITVTHSDDQFIVLFDRDSWDIDFPTKI